MNSDLLEEWRKLAKKIKKYNKLYREGSPLIQDDFYDTLYQRLVYIENIIGPQKNSPLASTSDDESLDKTSILDSIKEQKTVWPTGKTVSPLGKVDHIEPMLSLEHGFGADSISFFLKRFNYNSTPSEALLKRSHQTNQLPMVGEHKIDGVSIALRYKNGEFVMALTRGNGKCGTDVTRQLKYLSIPKTIEHKGKLEIRGEMYITFAEFNRLGSKFSSPRNACASIVHNKNATDEIVLRFAAHSCIGIDNDSYYDRMKQVESLGFEIIPGHLMQNHQDCVDFFNEAYNNRDKIEYPIDGVVFKLNNIKYWAQLGYNRTYPRYAFAIKFAPLSRPTMIHSIQIQVGKFGTITPVAVFDNVSIDGQNISRASLHNIQELYRNNYGVGDKIIVSRSGDTVPYVTKKLFDANNCIRVTNCPSCNSTLEEFERTLRCTKSWECVAQRITRIQHFCSRNAFNMDGIGLKIIEEFVNNNFVYYPVDIFQIPDKTRSGAIDLKFLAGWHDKSISNLINTIESSRTINFANFLFAICIPNVGYGHAQTLAHRFGSFRNLIESYAENYVAENCGIEDQLPISQPLAGIGKAITNAIKDFLNNPKEQWVHNIDCIVIV